MFLILGGVLVAYMCLGFLYAQAIHNNAIADVIYGKAVMLLVLASFFLGGNVGMGCILSILAICWGVRLSMRIYLKNMGKPEDARYAAWRSAWTARSQAYFLVRSFLQVFMLQGMVIALIASPIVLTNIYGLEEYSWYAFVGVALWIVGFIFESVADYQLDAYIKNPAHKGTLCTGGLWHYSRHPNYFGESLMWWGIAIAAAFSLPFGLLTLLCFVSPVLITFLLLKVSGIPMLEPLMKDKPGWAEYAARTNAFIPWFPRKGL